MSSIRRSKLSFDDGFVRIPNRWARDERLSRKARGLLAEIMSHSVGWVVTERSLIDAGTEGRDAVRGGLRELEECGYIVREQDRGDGGKFSMASFHVVDPWAESPSTDNPQAVDGLSVDGLTVDGLSAAHIRRPIPKKTKPQEEKEHNACASVDESFDEWWAIYPRKVAVGAARPAYAKAWKKIGAETAREVLLAGVTRLAAWVDQTRPEARHVPHASTWLNQERWLDEASSMSGAPQRAMTAAERTLSRLNLNAPVQGSNHDWSANELAR